MIEDEYNDQSTVDTMIMKEANLIRVLSDLAHLNMYRYKNACTKGDGDRVGMLNRIRSLLDQMHDASCRKEELMP